MTTYLSATFTGADTAAGVMPNADTGQAFTQSVDSGSASWRILSNQAVETSTTARENHLRADSGIADGTFTATLAVKPSGGFYTDCSLVIRGASATSNTFIMLNAEQTVYTLYRKVAGTFTAIGTVAKNPAAGDVMSIVASGSTLTASVGGVSVTVTETTGQTATWVGIRGDTDTGDAVAPRSIAFDNLTATDGAAPLGAASAADDVTLAADLTGIAAVLPVALGSATTADDVTLAANLTVIISGTIALVASTGSDVALAATLNTDLVHLLPWTRDVSGKTLLDIVLADAEMAVTPPFAAVNAEGLPPINTIALPPVVTVPGFPPVMVERVLTRTSVTVPAMAPGLDGRVHVNDAVYDAYPSVKADVGVVHTIIGGQDFTYFRGSPVGGTEHLASPFGDISASVSFPQITPQDQPGVGVLAALDHDKSFERIMVHPNGTIRRLWSGHLVSDDGGNDASGPRTSWEAVGTLFQASTFGHRVPLTMKPTDRGTIIARSLNRVIGRVYPVLPVVATGITTQDRGSSTDSELAYVGNLLATMWTAAGRQWTIMKTPGSRSEYRLGLKGMTTVHHTVTTGQRGVEVNLSRDKTGTVNCILGHGILPNGYAWSGRVWPNFHPDTTPAYPFANTANVITVGTTDAMTDSGSGVSDWQQKVNDLNLTPNVVVDGVFNINDSATLLVIQKDAGLTEDGILGPQSWSGTFNGGDGNSGDLFGSYRRPLAIHTKTEPYLFSASGAVIGKNPGYAGGGPGGRRYELDLNYGAGSTPAQAKVSATLQIARDRLPGYVGTITLQADTREDSRFFIIPNQGIKLIGYNGRDVLLHVVSVDRDYDSLTVTLTVDEKARDAMTVAAIRERDKAAKADPARRPGFSPKRSSLEQDLTVEFDGDSPAGVIPKTALYGGLWIRIPFPLSQGGSIAKIELRTSPPTKFYFSIFNSTNVTPAHLVSNVGNPGVGTEPYARTDAKGAALDALGLIQGYGEAGAACGYGLKSEGTGTLSGEFGATSPQTYNAQEDGAVSLLVYAAGSCSISGRIYPSPVQ